MKALIYKEFRELLAPALVVVLVASVLLLVEYLWGPLVDDQERVLAGVFFMLGAPLLGLVAGSHTLAHERGRRSEAFQGSFPVSRGAIWAAKLCTGLLMLALVYLLLYTAAFATEPEGARAFSRPLPELGTSRLLLHAATTFLVFCLGFCLSGTRRNPFEAAGVGLLAALLLFLFWMFLAADVLPRFFGPQLGIFYNTPSFSTPAILATILGLGLLVASGYGYIASLPLAYSKRLWRTTIAGAILCLAIIPAFFVGVRCLGEPGPEDVGWGACAEVSPDGEWVMFYDHRAFYRSYRPPRRLWRMRPDGSELKCLARQPVEFAVWLPDSKRVFVSWGDRDADFHFLPRTYLQWDWLIDVADGKTTSLPALEYVEDETPQFSPQGTYMSYGASLVRLRPQPVLLEMQLPQKATVVGWEEDESGIYFSYSKNDRLTLARTELPSGSPLGRVVAQGPEEAESVELSPHARWVVWGTRLTRPANAVATLENLGSGARLEVAGWPAGRAWSPDEQYVWMQTNGRRIAVVDLAHLRVIREFGTSDFSGEETLPWRHWSLDGKRVTLTTHKVVRDNTKYRRDEITEWGPIHVWVTNANGSGLRRIAETAMTNFTDFYIGGWTADGQIIVTVEKRKIISIDPDTGVQTDILTSSVPPENSEAEGRY